MASCLRGGSPRTRSLEKSEGAHQDSLVDYVVGDHASQLVRKPQLLNGFVHCLDIPELPQLFPLLFRELLCSKQHMRNQ